MPYDTSEATIDIQDTRRGELLAGQSIFTDLRDRILASLPGAGHHIVLFGWQARSGFEESSDLDVLVVLDPWTTSALEQLGLSDTK
jgi:predicted nucleotidyltransferase